MKKTLLVILIIALVATLTVGIIYAIGGSSAEVKYINLSLSIVTEIKYAVKADSLSSGATLGLEVREGSPDSDKVIEAENQGVTTINGESYVVFSIPVNSDDMTADYYATPYIERGSSRSYGECKKSSVVEYAIRKKAMLGDDGIAISELLDALLEYRQTCECRFLQGGARQRYP